MTFKQGWNEVNERKTLLLFSTLDFASLCCLQKREEGRRYKEKRLFKMNRDDIEERTLKVVAFSTKKRRDIMDVVVYGCRIKSMKVASWFSFERQPLFFRSKCESLDSLDVSLLCSWFMPFFEKFLFLPVTRDEFSSDGRKALQRQGNSSTKVVMMSKTKGRKSEQTDFSAPPAFLANFTVFLFSQFHAFWRASRTYR